MRWVTKNIGIGITNINHWQDRIYLSEDESRGKDVVQCTGSSLWISCRPISTLWVFIYNVDNGDSILGTFHISGYLAAGANYTKSVNIRVPERIFGAFYILVFTDIYNQVYEHTSEDDNIGFPVVRYYILSVLILRIQFC